MTAPATGQPGQPAGAPAQPAVITGQQLNARIQHGDPNFPKELWGRTLADAMKYYAIMREDFMRRNTPGQAPAAEVPAARASAPPQPAQMPGYIPPAPAPTAQPSPAFDADSMRRMIDEAVRAAVAPLSRQAADTTYDRIKREYSDWATYNAAVLEALAGASEEQLSNPETWRTAYFFVKGKALSAGGAPAAAPAADPSFSPTSFFVEGPSAPAPSAGGNPSDLLNDPRVLGMARRFGITPAEYIQWMGGNVPPMTPPGAPNV